MRKLMGRKLFKATVKIKVKPDKPHASCLPNDFFYYHPLVWQPVLRPNSTIEKVVVFRYYLTFLKLSLLIWKMIKSYLFLRVILENK